MLGWWILISTHTPEERDASDSEAARAAVVAQWEVGPGGLDWIEGLVSRHLATKLKANGYPNRYTAAAGEVLAQLEGGPVENQGLGMKGKHYILPEHWRGAIKVDFARLTRCDRCQLLTIDAWDLS